MMLRTIISMMGGVPATNPYTLAFVSTVASRGGSVTANEIIYLSAFEASMGSDLLEFDRLWIHGLGDSVAARTSFVNPSSTMLTAINNPTFSPFEGYQGNGINQYLDTNYNASTQGVKYTLNSASIGVYTLTNLSATQLEIGSVSSGVGNQSILDIRDGDRFYSGINEPATNISSSNLDSRGLFIGNRLSASSVNQYKNGVLTQSGTNASVVIPTVNTYLLCINVNVVPNLFSTRKVSFSFLGSSAYNQSNFYNAVQTLGTSLGWFSYTNAFREVVISRGGSLTSAEESYLRTFEASVGSDLAEFDRLWIHGLSNDVAASTSFVNPSTTGITAVNSPTFTANQGYQGNGSTSYLNTNYNPSTQGVKYTLNNTGGFVYILNNVVSTGVSFGSLGSGAVSVFLYPQYANSLPIYYANDGGADSYGSCSSDGLLTVTRTSNTTINLYKNGALNAASNRNSTLIPNLPLFICGFNLNGNLAGAYSGKISATGFGSSNFNKSNFYSALQTLGTSIGWAV